MKLRTVLIRLIHQLSTYSWSAIEQTLRGVESSLTLYTTGSSLVYQPDKHVKNNHIRKQPVKNKVDLKNRLTFALDSLQQNTRRIISFFHMSDTKYTSGVA